MLPDIPPSRTANRNKMWSREDVGAAVGDTWEPTSTSAREAAALNIRSAGRGLSLGLYTRWRNALNYMYVMTSCTHNALFKFS